MFSECLMKLGTLERREKFAPILPGHGVLDNQSLKIPYVKVKAIITQDSLTNLAI